MSRNAPRRVDAAFARPCGGDDSRDRSLQRELGVEVAAELRLVGDVLLSVTRWSFIAASLAGSDAVPARMERCRSGRGGAPVGGCRGPPRQPRLLDQYTLNTGRGAGPAGSSARDGAGGGLSLASGARERAALAPCRRPPDLTRSSRHEDLVRVGDLQPPRRDDDADDEMSASCMAGPVEKGAT